MPTYVWLLLGLLCSGSVAQAGDVVLRRGNGPDVETLDPHQVRSVAAGNVVRDLYEGLVSEAPDGSLIPGVAERWDISADGLVYVFFLRDTARWSNGDAVTAADFVAGLRRSVDPQTASPSSQLLAPIAQASAVMAGRSPPAALAVQALDEHRLQIGLQSPTPYFLALLVNPAAYPVHGPVHGQGFTSAAPLVSNGAYQLQVWMPQSHIELRRNRHYWNDAATRIDRVQHIVTEDMGSEFQRFRAGELDITEQVPATQIAAMAPTLRRQLRIADYLGIYYYGFNVSQPPFDQPGLRRALSLAVDREVIVRKVLGSGERAAYAWLPPHIAGADSLQPPWASWTRDQRVAEARRLYEQAGYSAQYPLRTEILYNTNDYHQKIALVIAAMWKQFLGVETRLRNEETKVFLQSRRERRRTQIFRGSWVSDYDDASGFLDLLGGHNPRNDTSYVSQRYDAALNAATHLPEDARRQQLRDAQQQLIDDAPVIPIYFYVTKHLVSPRVSGWQDNALDHHYSRDLGLSP
ncbi:peptide ABC transporter substrate-binding protein [Hydrocarboniphaga sp.]|uniref:peptide ABC transporter substrate-binding protein n=1 Tax=Hydrocarboniphaga sp. TaxID=2033016 RepID=UPI00260CB987|nr:peptide ABC transporter substrate-binding protein [Hydrocarboniphaga sp.]